MIILIDTEKAFYKTQSLFLTKFLGKVGVEGDFFSWYGHLWKIYIHIQSYVIGKDQMISLSHPDRTRLYGFDNSIQHCMGCSIKCNKIKRINIQTGKEEIELYLQVIWLPV